MATSLRALLVIMSICTFIYMTRKMRKAQLQTPDALFWTTFALTIMAMSLFPQGVIRLTEFVGVQSPVNFVYLVVIFFLLVRIFLLNLRISRLELRLEDYVLKMATREALREYGD